MTAFHYSCERGNLFKLKDNKINPQRTAGVDDSGSTCCQTEEMSKVNLCPLKHQSTCEQRRTCLDVKYTEGTERNTEDVEEEMKKKQEAEVEIKCFKASHTSADPLLPLWFWINSQMLKVDFCRESRVQHHLKKKKTLLVRFKLTWSHKWSRVSHMTRADRRN